MTDLITHDPAPPAAGLTDAPMTAPQAVLSQMAIGPWIAQPLYVVCALRVPDALADGPLDSLQLAERVDAHPRSLYRVLRCLAMFGVFHEDDEGRFALTEMGHCLRSDVPGSVRGLTLWTGEEWHWRAWGQLLHTVRTGEMAFRHVHDGKDTWGYLDGDPAAAESFDKAMTANAVNSHTAIIPAYDFAGSRTVLDVAGGEGHLLRLLLEHHPHLEGILFDQPGVAAKAEQQFAAAGLGSRARVVGGSFFEEIPAGADTYLITAVVHDWDDERARRILTNIARAMGPEAKLLIVEMVVPGPNEFGFGKVTDIEQLVAFCGHERTEEEYRELLASAGLRLARTVPTAGPSSVLEAVLA